MDVFTVGLVASVAGYFIGKGIEVLVNRKLGIGWTYRNINNTITRVAKKSQGMHIFGGSLDWVDNTKVMNALQQRIAAGRGTRILYESDDDNRTVVEARVESLRRIGFADGQLREYNLDFEGVGADSVWWYKPRKTVFTPLGRIRESRFRMISDTTVHGVLNDRFQSFF